MRDPRHRMSETARSRGSTIGPGKRLLPASRRPRLSAGAQVANDLMDRCRLDTAQQCDAGRLAALAGAEPVHGERGVAVPSHVASDPRSD